MSKEIRKKYFKGFDGLSVWGVDLGTRAMVRSSFSTAELFVIDFLRNKKVDDKQQSALITRAQLTKAFIAFVKAAFLEVDNLKKSGKKVKEIDKALLKVAGLIKGGRIKATVAIDKSAVFAAVRYLYLTENVLFSVALTSDGEFTIRQKEYIPGLIEEK